MAFVLWRSFLYKTLISHINCTGIRALSKFNTSQRIVSSEDGNVVVCWHPEVDFPYEKSLPITPTKLGTNKVFNVQHMNQVTSIINEKKPEFLQEKLIHLTYTTKHRWVPEGRHKRRRKRDFEENRPYL